MGTLLSYLCSMLTKYYIEIDGVKAEVPKGCLKNWDEIKCVYKRSDFSGVTRSFTTQFEFVGEMYDRLMALYLRDGVNARAVLSLYTITNEWAWEEQFTCDLDFSSIEWDNYVVKMNCIDDSLAAAIKAKKSTKFEFVVGQDIPVADTLEYDRIEMSNMVQHVIAGDGANELNGQYVSLHKNENKLVPTYVEGDGEVYENSPIVFHDQDTGGFDSFIEVEHDVNNLELSIEINTDFTYSGFSKNEIADIYLIRTNASGVSARVATVFHCSGPDDEAYPQSKYLGTYASLDALKKAHPTASGGSWSIVGKKDIVGLDSGTIFAVMPFGNNANDWVISDCAFWDWFWNNKDFPALYLYKNKFVFSDLKAGDKLSLVYTFQSNIIITNGSPSFSVKSKIQTSWGSRANTIGIEAISPESLAKAILEKICENKINITPLISSIDSRIGNTYILAAESIRGIPNAKLYTTFNDFCGWMESVFGYTYYLGPRIKSRFKHIQEYSMVFPIGDSHLLHSKCPGGHGSQVIIVEGTPYFAVMGDDNNADGSLNFYTKWNGSEAYNDPTTGKARLDTLFYDTDYNQGVYFDNSYTLQSFSGDVNRGVCDSQTIHFVHRSEIFAGDHVVKLSNIRGLEYSVNTGIAYSSLTVGYEKQEYEAECGRDEWNFSVQYTTGIDKFEKRLSLVSKYRADCYGIEFLCQERAKDTTDNKSDNSVFFAHCKTIEKQIPNEGSENNGESSGLIKFLVLDRSAVINGALSDSVFNGEYAPYLCAKANAAYIAAAKCPMALKFASFDGNTEVSIDGIKGNADLQLTEQLFTLGEVQFSSADVDTELDVNALYEVQSNGITYRGFLKEVSFKYAKAETVKYKLIVKEIEL